MVKLKVPKVFVDTVRVFVQGGTGGMGLPKYKGIGGKGGTVYLEATKGLTFNHFNKKFGKKTVTAESGKDSKTMKIYGENGKDKVVPVPVGVTIYDEFMRNIGELNSEGERVIVAEGGPGGSPTSNPPFSGSKGHSQVITVDLKLLADVGLVGFPNAGKSTLLKAVSRANPKIAAYAFTTLQPKIGVIEYPDFRKIQMADLPGLVEGASHDVGLGHKFLRHVERSSVLLMVVDIEGFQLTPQCEHRNCIETVILLNKELELYKNELLDKPAILAINKMDLPGAPSTYKEIRPHLNDLPNYAKKLPEELRPMKYLTFDEIVPISAAHDSSSIEKLKVILRDCLDKHFELAVADIMNEKEMNLLKKLKRNYDINRVVL